MTPTMRSTLVGGALLVLVPAMFVLATPASMGCRSCEDSSYCTGVTMSARFRAEAESLTGGKATVCWRDACSTATLPRANFVGALRGYGDSSGDFRLERDGTSVLEFQPYIVNEKAFELQIADGDRYRFEVRDGRGAVLVDAERTATYTETDRAASSCYQEPCRSALLVFEGVR